MRGAVRGWQTTYWRLQNFCMFLQQSSFFDERVTKPLLRRVDFLRESGGFALMSATYYFDDTEFRKL